MLFNPAKPSAIVAKLIARSLHLTARRRIDPHIKDNKFKNAKRFKLLIHT